MRFFETYLQVRASRHAGEVTRSVYGSGYVLRQSHFLECGSSSIPPRIQLVQRLWPIDPANILESLAGLPAFRQRHLPHDTLLRTMTPPACADTSERCPLSSRHRPEPPSTAKMRSS